MARFTEAIKNLWNVPEDSYDDDDDYVEEKKSRKNSHRGSQKNYQQSSYKDYDDYNSEARDPYSDVGYNSSYSSNNSSYDYDDNQDDYYEDGDYSVKDEYDVSDDYSDYENQSSFVGSNGVFNVRTTMNVAVTSFIPENFSNSVANIADSLSRAEIVFLNLESTPRDESRRIIDFMSGCTYMARGNIQRVSKNCFIITPKNVVITGDIIEQLIGKNGLNTGNKNE